MIDFIEYVVAELKSKRLSKADAVRLVQQFSRRSTTPATASLIHPLLHRNISDLNEQRYSSIFTGHELFLADHQVAVNGRAGQKVLPGVAYLEMVRAAIEQALPLPSEPTVLELHNTVWAQPIVVSESKQVDIALSVNDGNQVDYEIYSQDADQEIVHCQGRALWSPKPPPVTLDLEQLEREMTRGKLEPDTVYAACARMGLMYGPSFQGITAIHRGAGQVLTQLRLPASATGAADYVLHPSLMDGALQAAIGLADNGPESVQARLPFALETLRILSPCTSDMFAWLRYVPGSQATDRVVKLDIDLCDEQGNVCIQMRGFSWRALGNAAQSPSTGSLLAVPIWQPNGVETAGDAGTLAFAESHVILCDLSHLDVPHTLSLKAERQKNLAERFSEYALSCFDRIQSLLRAKLKGKVLVQVVVADDQEQAVLAGLSGLLKTAALENPLFIGQLILVPPAITAEELQWHLEDEKRGGLDPLIRYEQSVRQVLRWQEVSVDPEQPPVAFHDHGVYLITGGLGGLGVLFAREILEQTRNARVVVTGRSGLSAEKKAQLHELSPQAGRVTYRELDLGNRDQVRQLIETVKDEYGQLNGILHCAGMIEDQFILKKNSIEFAEVLAPKVTGTYNLDQASRDVELDFLVLFSSAAAAMGNPGQADYATANGFMDHFAAYRNQQVSAKLRHGRTRSINWPLWQAGGMAIDAASQERLQQTSGMQPLQTTTGVQAFYRSLAAPGDQMLVVEGDRVQIRRALFAGPAAPAERQEEQPAIAAEIDRESLAEKTELYLRRQFSELLKLPAQQIDPRAALENYGIDSILAMKLTNQLETTFGSLSKTLFFEYQTIRELAEYFIAQHSALLIALLAPATTHASEAVPPAATVLTAPARLASSRRSNRRRSAVTDATKAEEPIAIIGLSGRYPEAVNLETYWSNLRDGKDCIVEVPRERWDWREYFSEDRSEGGHHYSKWGGFIAGVDEFDPLFFNIPPVGAELIDPQERLFLQHAWMAIEDAGYTRASLQVPYEHDLPGQVGVYVGVMYAEYQLFGAEATARGERLGVPGSVASISNRVSYALNLHGPSMTLDTMCSSSLTAIHIACEDLKRGRTSLAIAGGVNVTIHPNKYLVLSEGQFISSDGHCQSFGEGGDGYIPGEGVGVVVLKRLSEAERAGDHIYGIIRGSALSHGGKTNGYSVPNPQAQTGAISRALTESHIDARHISYIEAHGTGTKLGDPIEIAALNKAFQKYTTDTQFCLIGSAKSNIGHCESAAGIAGLTKILLQMEHQQIVPSLHSARLNPYIDFEKSPFLVNQELKTWEQPVIDGRTLPRIAGLSSFGAGGSNAHMIVEEHQPPVRQPMAFVEVVILLSARTAEQLEQKARDLLDFLRPRRNTIDLVGVAYTLQVGREPMDERLAFIVSSAAQLIEKLQAHVAGQQRIEDSWLGQVKRNNETLSLFSTDSDLQEAIGRWMAGRKLSKLLDLWVKGLEVDWNKLYGDITPPRVSLPAYPFARERYWIDTTAGKQGAAISTLPSVAAPSVIHPLLHTNTSDLSQQRYSSTLTGEEFFLVDHQVSANGRPSQKVLPGVAYLEMARAAIEQAVPARPDAMMLELHNTVWAQPIVVTEKKQVSIALSSSDDEQLDYEIYSEDADQEVVHCQGRAVFSRQPAPAKLDLERLEARMEEGSLEADGVYATLTRMGLVYGPAFQGITALQRGSGELLARLRLPSSVVESAGDYILHPSLMDGALQAAVGLVDVGADPTQPRVPFALDTLRIIAPCTPEMMAWVRYAAGSQAADNVVRLDVDLCDALGNVCVQMHGFSSRVMTVPEKVTGSLLATPVWLTSGVEVLAGAKDSKYSEHHVVLCELSNVDAGEVATLLPHSRCLSLEAGKQERIAQRYGDYALACLERIQEILGARPEGKVLFQIVVPDYEEQALLAGLSGLLKTAALENPHFVNQLILVPAETTAEELASWLRAEQAGAVEALIRYEQSTRQVLRWQEVPASADQAPIAFKDGGVYLITGGLGGLGTLFAREILEQSGDARVVLTGRSAMNAETKARLETLSAPGRVGYRQVDLSDLDQVKRLIAAVNYEHHQLNGILHCSGMIADHFILNKAGAEFSEVLEPKVTGTYNLDQASRLLELDFFVLFSSVAGALGNVGQADYATANGFMDQLAAYRNRQVAARQRHGRTLSINWPLWQAGGMGIDPAAQELLQQTTGMQPLQTVTGMQAFHRSLSLPYDQMLVVEGDLTILRRALLAGPAMAAEPEAEQPALAMVVDDSFAEKTRDYLRKQLSALLKMPSHRIDPQAPLETYGIDSILSLKLTNQLEKTFGSLSKTLFFEYQTIHELGDYFTAHHSAQLSALLSPASARQSDAVQVLPSAATKLVSSRRFSHLQSAAPPPAINDEPIAIVGLSGRYPEALDLEAYWVNLRDGKDCISEVPTERWNWREYFSDDRQQSGHHYSKWGGFIAGVDEFDPLFFSISPVDAELIDPQERLFLQHAWMAMEDAGYTRASLQVPYEHDLPGQVGVYAGVMYNEYQLFGAEAAARGKRLGIPGSTASIANRVSYALNLHGPSVTLDTMCSSSLTAIHYACQDLKLGRTSVAIAGGVNVTVHPNKYLVLSAGQFISSDGHCQSFGEGGDGYIPGEGVGVVVLKRLSEAKRDGDHIYGLIRGSALNHGGKTNGYTVPNPQAQATAISRALAESHIDARHISYVEAHGTGTTLGDPIEIAALSKAFHQDTQDTEFCRIGSVKSNIGHCESAAGVAGLTKVLLQMQHQQIVPSLHSAQLNPHIDFARSPFIVNQSLRTWEQPVIDGRKLPRIAGLSSFGAGGSNAHLLIEEYQPAVSPSLTLVPVVILLSARTGEQLEQKVRDLLDFVQPRLNAIDLVDLAYTLQVGREPMEERLGFVVSSAEELIDKLRAYAAGEQGLEDVYQGQVKRSNETLSVFSTDGDLQQTVDKWIGNNKVAKLLDLWVKGLELDWSKLYGEARPRRISLPTYPFARERYWIDTATGGEVAVNGLATAVLHPLLHSNTSDLSEQRYRSAFTGDEFFIADHQVKADGRAASKVLPGVAYLEMARAAVEEAWRTRPEATVLELRNVVWAQPIVVTQARQISLALAANDREQVEYEIYSHNGGEETVHCQGIAVASREPAPQRLDLEQLAGQMDRGLLQPDGVYAAFARIGLNYGPALQGISSIQRGTGQILARLRLPATVEETSGDYVLHPSLMDSAIQAAVGLVEDLATLSTEARVPFALDVLRIVSPCTSAMVSWVRHSAGSQAGDPVVKLDIDLCDERGNVCVQMRGLSSRALRGAVDMAAAPGNAIGSLLAVPVWQADNLAAGRSMEFAEHHVALCEMSSIDTEQLQSLLPQSHSLSLQFKEGESISQRYSDYAVACFERVQSILCGKPQGQVLVQIVVPDHQERVLFAGLSALLKTAALENPRFTGQLMLVSAGATAEELARQFQNEKSHGADAVVRYSQGKREVLRWQEVPAELEQSPLAFREDGVYLITGGFGGLGLLFAKEILERTGKGRVVLTGRSALTAKKQGLLDALSGQAARVSYRQLDLGDAKEVSQRITSIRGEYGRLNGILHSAGMISDHFIVKKGGSEFEQVLAPKVTGTFHLDHASRDVELDFFVLFSSIAGAMGNLGQADYATANGFMDQFASYRNRQVTAKERHGRTRSINWPLWQAGGMEIGPATLELLQQTTGMQPMQTAAGMQAFYRSLVLPHDQVLVVEGDLGRIRHALLASPAILFEPQPERTTAVVVVPESFAVKAEDYLRTEFSALLKVPFRKIDPQAALERYGIDSILAMKLTNQLEKTFGSLSKTLFFEYQSIAALAAYFMKAHPATLREKVGPLHEHPKADVAHRAVIEKPTAIPAGRTRSRRPGSSTTEPIDIAIVGLAGRYPQAKNLQEFWRNLQGGRDCITEVPSGRWDHDLYFDPDPNKPGKSYSKWGGFIDDVDKFDPLFFNISPKEAALLDPQERLFLETAWQTIEDAGYTKDSISGGRVGVYVGVMWGQYELFGVESMLRGNADFAGSSLASIANRVSYFFDFHGPSLALDTMCSSSLTAIHLACEELRRGEIDAAIAGGVNVTIHPYKYLSLSQGKFISSDGKCRSFGAGGDGYVPGEGVGAVLLKPLAQALRDGDQIYATIKSSTVNHGGKTNGYTVPNPNAQGGLILDALRKANIGPETLSYVETHGTGTSLGDPIEITGLLQAFEGSTEEKQFCAIGSVKSNIGHLESAAGIAAVTKALLQIRHNQLVPSLHAEPLNPNIDFDNSPFRVQTELADWKRTSAHPRRVGVSSFGAGGSNAHLILEEYVDPREPRAASQAPAPEIFVLSAKTPDALRRYAEKVADFLGDATDVSLASMAHTSQVGRTPMDARLAIVASSVGDLRSKLTEWINPGGSAADLERVFYGNLKEAHSSAANLIDGAAGEAFVEALLASRDLERIAGLWVLGAGIDWSLLYRNGSPTRVTLPTYPFAKERYWIDQEKPSLRLVPQVTQTPVAVEAPKQAEEKRRTYYYPQWAPKALAARSDRRSGHGPILILDPSDALFLAMNKQRQDGFAAESIVLVKPGKSFQQIAPDTYTIDPEREEQFHELLAHLESRKLLPGVVLHHASETCGLEVEQQVAQQLNQGLYALFNLCRALMKMKHQVPLRVMSVFSSHSKGTTPLGAAIGGFFKTLTLEEPGYLTKTIDIESSTASDGQASLLEKAALIRDELSEDDWTGQEIRYRDHGQTRFVWLLVAQTGAENKSAPLPLRQNGVYLITGGFGGLGIIFAEYLAKNFRSKLILIGRSAPDARQQQTVSRLEGYGAEVLTLQADVAKREDMERCVREAKARFSGLNGVIHAAGVNRDAFILRKTMAEIEAVLAPKVFGTIHVDLATRGEYLDFFALFSSVAGVIGNVGQSDYAFGNRFLDAFAENREILKRAEKRSGRTLSINWPLWEDGGMAIPQDAIALLEKQTGISPLSTQDGIRYWEDFLTSDAVQAVPLYGTPSRIAAFVARQPVKAYRDTPAPTGIDAATLFQRTEAYLKALIGEEIKLTPDRIGSSDPLESFGIDSVMINRINAQLENDLGALPKTLLYEHQTVGALATYLVRETREALTARFGSGGPAAEPSLPAPVEEPSIRYEAVPANGRDELEAIAIIGVHGYYPQSENLAEYWENLKQGRDLAGLVPANRWDYEEFYHPDPSAAADGKIYGKWGAFLDHHDKFDPRFFKISTAEARMIDPQERLFLESVWGAIEDAGYTRERLQTRFPKAGSADVGVFVGVTTNSYNLWAPEERSRGNFVAPTAMPWSIANRVSYFFDFNGPSLPIDTACSSSLVAIHLASESLRRGECQVAIAGGVNLYLHPAKYHSLCQRRMISPDGKTHSYGAGEDGFTPGEGVGTLVLKPVSKAIEDHDHIYAVIRASAYDHSGRSNGYSAPNPISQATLISHTLQKANIHPDTISYVEGHGTGTQLGDSLEIAALTRAFRERTERKQFCPIGSVKANLGHAESAAGIAGVAKVLLQMEHHQLAPSIHSDQPNPNIEFESSPFYLQHGLAEWPSSPAHPRRALVNSFGAGGVNACVVLEEYEGATSIAGVQQAGPCLFTLSARNEERLREYVDRLVARLRVEPGIDLASLCYTLQTGREAMEERLSAVVSDVDELLARLDDWSKRGSAASLYRGSLDPRRGWKRSSKLSMTATGRLTELASRWVAGEDVEWESLYSTTPRRIPLPGYPFARERYWLSDALIPERSTPPGATLHPLIAYNSSTLKDVSFNSSLADTAFYAVDHRVNEEAILPGAAFLEMACISGSIVGEQRIRKITDVVWMQPLSFRTGAQALRTVLRRTGYGAEYEISSFDAENEAVIHSEGRLAFRNGSAHPAEAEGRIPLETLKARCAAPEAGRACYDRFSQHGLQYGPAFQTIQELYVHGSFALSKLRIADDLKGDFGQYILHPSIIDGALQTVAGLAGSESGQTLYLPFAVDEIEIIRPVTQTCYAYAEFSDARPQKKAGVMKFNVRLVNESGDVLIAFRNLYVRPVARPLTGSPALAAVKEAATGRLLTTSGGAIG
ncbi:MAG TPA: SDR family NAD(P)-dependent oxidoreductase [Thermoanaerobaculia bacterium]|jgi:polyketide synthase PksN